jgi:hypothetical protein
MVTDCVPVTFHRDDVVLDETCPSQGTVICFVELCCPRTSCNFARQTMTAPSESDLSTERGIIWYHRYGCCQRGNFHWLTGISLL